MLKKINWGNVALIAVVCVITVLFFVPFVRPLAKKLPVLGNYVG